MENSSARRPRDFRDVRCMGKRWLKERVKDRKNAGFRGGKTFFRIVLDLNNLLAVGGVTEIDGAK